LARSWIRDGLGQEGAASGKREGAPHVQEGTEERGRTRIRACARGLAEIQRGSGPATTGTKKEREGSGSGLARGKLQGVGGSSLGKGKEQRAQIRSIAGKEGGARARGLPPAAAHSIQFNAEGNERSRRSAGGAGRRI
jgi:hypothetical protein